VITFTATPVVLVHATTSLMDRANEELEILVVRWDANLNAAYYHPDDAERVVAWLRERGAEERR